MADTQDDAKKLQEEPEEEAMSPPKVVGGVIGVFASLYVFLIGLGLMGDGFKCVGGRGAANMFAGVSNPIAGLMVGILATVMVQSSSTSTSITVGLVSADVLPVKMAIPMIYGANIGTSVTNSIVSMGQSGNRLDLERAFSGATVHDMFNMLTVLTLLPIEIIVAAISGEGGPMFFLSKGITEGLMGGEKSGKLFTSPTKTMVAPVAKLVISNNKYVINALSLGEPEKRVAVAGDFNATKCSAGRRLEAESEPASQWEGWRWVGEGAEAEDDGSRALLNRRLAADCAEYFCVNSDLDKNLKKTSSKAYEKLASCKDYQDSSSNKLCGGDKCYLDAGSMYQKYITDGHIIKGGFLQDAGDDAGGIIAVVISLILLCAGLFGLVKLLQMLLLKKAKKVIAKAVQLNAYLSILVGLGITIVVQSSSVTTSALTPLCGLGVIPLDKMLPLTLGANIGTTCTALIAALASMKFAGLQIALCHLCFNLIGILIWYPVPMMREVPLGAARLLGLYASFYRFVPALYILVMFVILPAILLGIAEVYDASAAGGAILGLLFVAAVGAGLFWWIKMEGCYKVLTKEQREERLAEVKKAEEEMLGEASATV